MHIFPIESGPVDTIGYLVSDEKTNQGIIIDTPMDSSAMFIEIIREQAITPIAIILTHSHWDHIADAAELKRQLGAPIMIHQDDEYRVLNPMQHTVWELPFTIEAVQPDSYLVNGDIIECGDLKFEILHTPGHTEGGICLVEHMEKTIFAGDTIFNGNIGRFDLPGGDGEILLKSIKEQILTLPDDYKIYSGHGEPTSIAEEKENNPYLREDMIL